MTFKVHKKDENYKSYIFKKKLYKLNYILSMFFLLTINYMIAYYEQLFYDV